MDPLSGSDVCLDEAYEWRQCLQTLSFTPLSSERVCQTPQEVFQRCVLDWRENKGGGQQKIKGVRPGEASPQCRGMSCDWQDCVSKNVLDQKRCQHLMRAFKDCVKCMYLDEYIQ